MNATIATGAALGLATFAWTCVMGATGWYKDPSRLNLFWLVIVIEIVALAIGLGRTRRGRGYWSQVGAGTAMAVIGGVIIFCGSILFTTVLFPHYFDDIRAMHVELLEARGLSQAQIDAAVAAAGAGQSSFLSALSGFMGTVITGFFTSLIIAAFVRDKSPGVQKRAAALLRSFRQR
jgi:hypothetical protein